MSFGCNCFSKFAASSFNAIFRFATAFAIAAVMMVLVGCAPAPIPREFKSAKMEFGPLLPESDVYLDEISVNQLPSASSFKWKGTVETSTWYRAAEDLSWIARQVQVPEIARLSVKMREAVMKASATWPHTVDRSPYVSAAIGETQLDSEQAIQQAVDMLTAQEPILKSLLASRSSATKWPSESVSLVDLVGRIEKFVMEFVHDVESSSVDPKVRNQIVEELRINFGPKLGRLRTEAALAYKEPKVYDFVRRLRETLKQEGIDLGPKLNNQLNLAERLPKEAERISTAKRALAVLIDFWLAASPETRELKFKPVSKDLYSFFVDQSEDDLLCLKSGCNLISVLKREIFILPKLEEYGIKKLRNKLVEAAQDSIRVELESQATAFLPKLHEEIGALIVDEMRRQKSNVTKISRDYAGYLRVAMARMAAAKLGLREKAMFQGVEPSRIRVKFDFDDGGISAASEGASNSASSNGNFTTGASAIGAGLALAIEQFENHLPYYLSAQGLNPIRQQQSMSRTLFEQLNKALLIGGFRTEAAKPFDALSVVIDRDVPVRSRFNLRSMAGSPLSFAVPDKVFLSNTGMANGILGSAYPARLSVSVGGQADMIRGLSRLAIQLKDWKKSKFDETLGPVVLADFVPDLPKEAVDQKLFPKELFFAAAMGNAAIILQNSTKKSSSIGLISPQKTIRWANEPIAGGARIQEFVSREDESTKASVAPAEQETMAVVFDLVNGERSKEAKISEVARFLSALTVFLKALEDIEKSKSKVLLEPDARGVTPIDQLSSGRQDVKLLVMAIANFLSKEARGGDGLVRPTYFRSKAGLAIGARGEPRLLEQALVIRALLDASEAISAEIYRNEAQDIFSVANRLFFKPELAFYSDDLASIKSPNMESLVAMLVAGESLKPYLSTHRQVQWIKLSKPWIGALRDAAERLP
jgi:hypothetical protein